MKAGIRKWLTRIAVAAAALLLAIASAAAWVGWRASRVPAWYTAAIDCPIDAARDAEQTQLIGFRNWLARSSAGNPDQLPESDRRYDLTLTADQINALLAKWTDNLRDALGPVQTIRVHLGDDEITVQGNWVARGRVVGVRLKCQSAGDARPSVWIDSVRVGEQGVPLSWVNAQPLEKLSAALRDLARDGKDVGIDAHGIATPLTFKASSGALLKSLVQGYSLEPTVFMSPQLSEQDTVPLSLAAAHSDGKSLTLTFQLLTPPEQKALLDHVTAVLATAK